MVENVAILGAGIGSAHLAAYRELPHYFKVLLVVDQDSTRAQALCEGTNIEIAADIKTALDHPDIDIIDICLPPHLHVPVAKAALQAGKDVICEKPIATSLAALADLREVLQETGGKYYPVFQYRWGPSLAQLRHLIKSGLAGQPHLATLETHWNRDAAYYASPWRGTWAGELGGAVLGHAIHNHDLLCAIMGDVVSVSGYATTRINPIETEDCAALSFEMKGGALAISSITLGNASDESRLRFVFEKLTATSGTNPYAPGAAPWIFTARDPLLQREIDEAVLSTPEERIGFEGYFQEIAKSRVGQPNTHVSFDDGVRSIELVTAIYHAVRTGQRVALPLPASHPLYGGWQP